LSYIYDAGALIAAERGSSRFGALHARVLRGGHQPIVPAAVLAQVWDGSSRQALLNRVLRGCEIEVFTHEAARAVGRMRAASKVADVVDVSVVEAAMRYRFAIVTSDPDDIAAILDGLNVQIPVERI
jgi:hypothetical protein